MDKGVQIDPVTLEPIEMQTERRAQEAEQNQDTLLKTQAAWLNIAQTEAGNMLLDLIQQKFTARIQALIDADPEALAYKKLMSEIGVKGALAESAARDLARKYLRRKEE